MLHGDEKLKTVVPVTPFAAFERQIFNTLCLSRFTFSQIPNGSSPCGMKRCQLSADILTCYIISSYAADFSSHINQFFCRSTNITCIIYCTFCDKQYVGDSTNFMREYFYDHKSEMNKENKSVSAHFSLNDHILSNHL